MITVAVLAIVLCAGVAVALLLAAPEGTVRRRFIHVSSIPATALLLEYLFWDRLARRLSYFAVVIPLLTCVASVILAVVGATFIASARERHEHHPALIYSTIIAALPGVLMAGYILLSVVRFVRRDA